MCEPSGTMMEQLEAELCSWHQWWDGGQNPMQICVESWSSFPTFPPPLGTNYIGPHPCGHMHRHIQNTWIDCCTAEGIGDFIDESLKWSLKQKKLFASQLESNGVMPIVSPFSDDKWAFSSLLGSLTHIHSYSSDPGWPLRRKEATLTNT